MKIGTRALRPVNYRKRLGDIACIDHKSSAAVTTVTLNSTGICAECRLWLFSARDFCGLGTKPNQRDDSLLGSRLLASNYACTLQGDQAAAHHWFQIRKECIDLFRYIDNLNHHREIHGKSKNLCGVHVTGLPEAQETADDSSACQTHVPRLQNDGLVKR